MPIKESRPPLRHRVWREPHLSLLNQYFIGYSVTFVGSLIGFAYAFVIGFASGYLVARIYNGLADLRENRRARRL